MHMFKSIFSFASLALLLCFATHTQAQTWPTQSVRIVVPYPAGGTVDILARRLGEKLAQKWKQAVVIENRPGGVEAIAATTVSLAPPDGYTLLLASESAFFLNPLLHSKLSYDPVAGFTPLTRVVEGPLVYVVKFDSPYQTMQSLLAAAKAEPGKISYGSTGAGGTPHLAVSFLSQLAGNVEFLHVPYRGAPPILVDVIAGVIHVAAVPLSAVDAFIKDKRLRPLAITGSTRLSAVLPTVPTLMELGYNDSTRFMVALAGPAKMPPDVANMIARDVGEVMKDRDFVAREVDAFGLVAMSETPTQFARYMATSRETWKARLTAAKVMPED